MPVVADPGLEVLAVRKGIVVDHQTAAIAPDVDLHALIGRRGDQLVDAVATVRDDFQFPNPRDDSAGSPGRCRSAMDGVDVANARAGFLIHDRR